MVTRNGQVSFKVFLEDLLFLSFFFKGLGNCLVSYRLHFAWYKMVVCLKKVE